MPALFGSMSAPSQQSFTPLAAPVQIKKRKNPLFGALSSAGNWLGGESDIPGVNRFETIGATLKDIGAAIDGGPSDNLMNLDILSQRQQMAKAQQDWQAEQQARQRQEWQAGDAQTQVINNWISTLPPDQQMLARVNPEAAQKMYLDAQKPKDPEYRTVGRDLVQMNPDGTVTPVYRAPKDAGSNGAKWRLINNPEEMARMGIQSPVLYDDETGNMKQAPGTAATVMADPAQRGRVVMTLPNALRAEKTLAQMEAGGYSIGKNDWGAAAAGIVPWDGGTAQQFIGGKDYQIYTNASKTFESAIMPILSGAAVTESEAKRVIQSALPQPGDGPARLAEKAKVRKGLINGAAAMIGKPPPYPDAPTLDFVSGAGGNAPTGGKPTTKRIRLEP